MKDLISNQLVKYLEDRGVEHIFGLCGHTEHRGTRRAVEEQEDPVHQYAP
jgi:thiamine pyrophosphate-dependent acetolactate synthase large subunit-like protein